MKVSILLLTYNESANLPSCLGALSWCDDIVVIDSGSTDETVTIATAHGARVLTRKFDNFAAQRNFGLDSGALRNDWVLHLDADEIITEAFADQLANLAPPPGVDALRVPFRFMFFGQWLRHAGMWPAYQVRIGHVQRLRFVQCGHGQREALPATRVGIFPDAILHYSFSHGLSAWLEKHVRYAHDEAGVILHRPAEQDAFKSAICGKDRIARRRAAKALSARLTPFARPIARFLYVYFGRLGFLDGKPGFVYAVMLSVYEAMTAILVYEQTRESDLHRQGRDVARLAAGTPSQFDADAVPCIGNQTTEMRTHLALGRRRSQHCNERNTP